MVIFRWVGVAAFSLSLMACSSMQKKPVYSPADETSPLGYSVETLSNQEYLVVFSGDKRLGLEQVEDFAFQRASELTIQQGKAGFDLLDKSCSEEVIAWAVPERRGNFVTGGDIATPVGESYVPGYIHEQPVLSCKLRVQLLDNL